MFALSLNELNKIDVAGVAPGPGSTSAAATTEVATDLVALARSDDLSSARNAVGALANLSENDATHERLLSWGAGFLSKLTLDAAEDEENNEEGTGVGNVGDAADVGLVREATRCLANLAGSYAAHGKLLEGGAADALVGSLKREDAITARFAALGLANLSGQVGQGVVLLLDAVSSAGPSRASAMDLHYGSVLTAPVRAYPGQLLPVQ